MGRNTQQYFFVGLGVLSLLFVCMLWIYVNEVKKGLFYRIHPKCKTCVSSARFSSCPECIKVIQKMAREPGKSYISTQLLDRVLTFTHEDKLMLHRFEKLHEPLESGRPVPYLTFLIMGSSVNKKRIPGKRESYMKWTQANYLIFSDEPDEKLGIITLPEIKGKADYKAAQFRQLYGLKYIMNNQSDLVQNTSWFILGDDDTWFNVPALTTFLSQYDPELLVAFGYIWTAYGAPGAAFSGGSGIALSRAATKLLARDVLTAKCPFIMLNDITLSECCTKNGIIKVHDSRFYFNKPPNTQINDIVSQFTYHYVNDPNLLRRLTCYTADAWNIDASDLDCRNYFQDAKYFKNSVQRLIVLFKQYVSYKNNTNSDLSNVIRVL